MILDVLLYNFVSLTYLYSWSENFISMSNFITSYSTKQTKTKVGHNLLIDWEIDLYGLIVALSLAQFKFYLSTFISHKTFKFEK